MYSIKNKINNNIINPSVNSKLDKSLMGKIITSNEYTNLCNLTYRDYDDRILQEKNVSVVVDNPAMVSWFPEPNDIVLLTKRGDTVIVTGPYIDNYSLQVRDKMQLKSDIYPESISETFSGFII